MLLAYLRSSNRKRWRSASATWDFGAAQRIVGTTPRGRSLRSSMARSAPVSAIGCPRKTVTKPQAFDRRRTVASAVQDHGEQKIRFAQRVDLPSSRGRSSEAEHQLPKLRTRVRFPSPALCERAGHTLSLPVCSSASHANIASVQHSATGRSSEKLRPRLPKVEDQQSEERVLGLNRRRLSALPVTHAPGRSAQLPAHA